MELSGPPGAVRFCMGLGRPGHHSGESAAATVGAPRQENNARKKLPGSGSTVRHSFREFPAILLRPWFSRSGWRERMNRRVSGTIHCPSLTHFLRFPVLPLPLRAAALPLLKRRSPAHALTDRCSDQSEGCREVPDRSGGRERIYAAFRDGPKYYYSDLNKPKQE